MPQPVDQEFFARLAELNEKFAQRLPDTLAQLAAQSQLLAAGAPAAPANELQGILHTLAGSAATFGFRGVGHQARLLEQRLRVLRTFEQTAAADWQAWRAELDEFIAAARKDPKGLPG